MLEILCCPVCGGTLSARDGGLACPADHSFPVVGGVPVLLTPDEAAHFGPEIARAKEQGREYRGGIRKTLIRIVKALVGSTFHLPRSRPVMETFTFCDGSRETRRSEPG